MRNNLVNVSAAFSTLLLSSLLWIPGCSMMARHEHTAALNQALQDDQTCMSQGWHYPAPRYVTCRMQLDDKRQYRSFMSLQMMKQTQTQRAGAPPMTTIQDAYRPLDRDKYQCQYITENGKDYILCGETTQS